MEILISIANVTIITVRHVDFHRYFRLLKLLFVLIRARKTSQDLKNATLVIKKMFCIKRITFLFDIMRQKLMGRVIIYGIGSSTYSWQRFFFGVSGAVGEVWLSPPSSLFG